MPSDYIEQLNEPVLKLDNSHPAKRFLSAFIECRNECVGRELDQPGQPAIDQQWQSKSDGRVWTFSAFAYGYLSTDIELDGFITNAPGLTVSEKFAIQQLPRFRTLMEECAQAAELCHNADCLELVREILGMLKRWNEYLDYRKQMIARSG